MTNVLPENLVGTPGIASGTINAGDILSFVQSASVNTVKRFDGTNFAGIAVTSAASGDRILYASTGYVNVNTTTTIAQAGTLLQPDSTTPYLAKQAILPASGYPIIGVSSQPGIGTSITALIGFSMGGSGGGGASAGRYVNVKNAPYNAVGNNTADDTTAIQNAINDVSTAGGGYVYIPPGNYKITAELLLQNNVEISGAGSAATFLNWTTDLGAGKYCIKPSPTYGTWGQAPRLLDFCCQGTFGHVLNPNALGCVMKGIKPGSNMSLTRVQASGFQSGLVMNSDHVNFNDCRFSNNFYNVEWEDGATTFGDNTYIHCYFDGSFFASLAVFGNNAIVGSNFLDCHAGFGPYGIYGADKGGHQLQNIAINCQFIDLAYEAVGNGCILDEGTGGGDSFVDCNFFGMSMMWHSTIRAGGWGGATTAITARESKYAVRIKSAAQTTFYPSAAADIIGGTGTGAAAWYFSNYGTGARIVGKGWSDTLPMFADANPENCNLETPDWTAKIFNATGTITKGDIVGFSGPFNSVDRCTGYNYAGIAMNDATNGLPVIVAYIGQPAVTTVASIASGGVLVQPDASTPYKARAVASPFSGYPIFGVSDAPGGATCPIHLTGAVTIPDASIEGMKLGFHIGTSPPSSPVNGMLWIYNGLGVYWMFVYDNSETTYKWKFIGGAPAFAYVAAFESTASTTYVALTTAGPSITVPRAGIYTLEYGAAILTPGGASLAHTAYASLDLGGTAANDNWAAWYDIGTTGAVGYIISVEAMYQPTLAASDAIVMKYRSFSASATAQFGHRFLKITPTKVS